MASGPKNVRDGIRPGYYALLIPVAGNKKDAIIQICDSDRLPLAWTLGDSRDDKHYLQNGLAEGVFSSLVYALGHSHGLWVREIHDEEAEKLFSPGFAKVVYRFEKLRQ